MGQRHQIFLKIANPIKFVRFNTNELKTEAIKQFGEGEFTILAYHNQWLFGRGALQNALGLLRFAKQFTKAEKTDTEALGAYNCPFSINGMKQKFNIDEIITNIGFIMNYRPINTAWLDAGIGSSFYLNNTEPEMRLDFTIGDNNDGITIIDLVENKYCFMNIYDQDNKSFNVSKLQELKPVNARTYVGAYYGETIKATNPYTFGNHNRTKVTMSVNDQQKIVNRQIKINTTIVKGFDKFEVLTLDELQVMFDTMVITKKEAKAEPKVYVRKARGQKIKL